MRAFRNTGATALAGDDQADWREQAACLGEDDDVFFPVSQFDDGSRAKAICGTCPVRAECLDLAIERRERHGVWGGLTEAERLPFITTTRRTS